MSRILLINPPWHRNSEPPLGLGLIQAFLRANPSHSKGISYSEICDLNAEAAIRLPQMALEDGSTRRHRALKHRSRVMVKLTTAAGYQKISEYQQLMSFYGDLLTATISNPSETISPGNYTDTQYKDFGPDTVKHIWQNRNRNHLFSFLDPVLKDRLDEIRPTIIGISLGYRSQFVPGLHLAFRLKSFSDIKREIVIGGSFCACLSQSTKDTMRELGLRVCDGPGESYFTVGRSSRRERIPFLKPDFTGIDFGLYFSPVRVMPLIASRGCYWGKCLFCDECKDTFYMSSKAQFLSVFQDSETKSAPELVHFTDNAIPPAVLKRIAEVKDFKYSWYGFVRATPELTDPDFVVKLARSGCQMLQIGFESPVQNVVNAMGKGVKTESYPKILKNLRKAGIRSYVYLMFGYPGQEPDDHQATIDFLNDYQPDYINASIFRLPPGSPLSQYQNSDQNRLISAETRKPHRLYLQYHGNVLAMDELRKWMSREFYSDSIVRQIIQKTPRYYKSSHAVFF